MSRKSPPEPQARVPCQTCGPVRVPYSALTIRVCIDNRDAEYRFVCPDCLKIQVTRIHPSMLHGLMSQPLTVEWFYLPRELSERHEHPPLTLDDILDFKRELTEL